MNQSDIKFIAIDRQSIFLFKGKELLPIAGDINRFFHRGMMLNGDRAARWQHNRTMAKGMRTDRRN